MKTEVMEAMFNLILAMAKAEAEENKAEEEESLPDLLEDEIAEILDDHKGDEILIHFNPEGPLRYRYYSYEKDKDVVFTIYDALENHCLVTVNGTNILDLY